MKTEDLKNVLKTMLKSLEEREDLKVINSKITAATMNLISDIVNKVEMSQASRSKMLPLLEEWQEKVNSAFKLEVS